MAAITILSDFGAQENKVCHCFHFSPFYLPCHSSTLTWKIPWMEEPGGLQSMRSLRVWHDWATSLSLFTFMHWRRKWQSTPVFLPGESQGRQGLVSCRLWGLEESDTTEQLQFHFSLSCLGGGNGNPLQCSCLENPRDGESGGLPSMGSHRVGHDWSNLAAAAAMIKKWIKRGNRFSFSGTLNINATTTFW